MGSIEHRSGRPGWMYGVAASLVLIAVAAFFRDAAVYGAWTMPRQVYWAVPGTAALPVFIRGRIAYVIAAAVGIIAFLAMTAVSLWPGETPFGVFDAYHRLLEGNPEMAEEWLSDQLETWEAETPEEAESNATQWLQDLRMEFMRSRVLATILEIMVATMIGLAIGYWIAEHRRILSNATSPGAARLAVGIVVLLSALSMLPAILDATTTLVHLVGAT